MSDQASDVFWQAQMRKFLLGRFFFQTCLCGQAIFLMVRIRIVQFGADAFLDSV